MMEFGDLSFFRYWGSVFNRLSKSMKSPLERGTVAVVTVILTTVLLTREDKLDWSHVGPRILAGVLVAAGIFVVYLLIHAVRSPWLFHKDTTLALANAALERDNKIEALNQSLGHVQAKLGRPHVVLRFSTPEPPKPYFQDGTMIHDFRDSGIADPQSFRARCL